MVTFIPVSQMAAAPSHTHTHTHTRILLFYYNKNESINESRNMHDFDKCEQDVSLVSVREREY